jgi:ribosomal protein S18 acetylase RimI-like enzyme
MAKSRPLERESDLRLIQGLISDTWRLVGPVAPVHVGDVTWWLYQHLNKLAEVRIQLWLDGDECVAFAWNWLKRDALDCLVHPERPELLDDVLSWADADVVYAQESDAEKVAGLEARGYERRHDDAMNHMVLSLAEAPGEPRVPDGYRLRTVGPGDLERRVEVHRAAFAPSRVVPESYARLQREWPYRADLDHVVEAPDGSLAAFCIAWLDEKNRAGLLEPVGTHPDHRRRGLASAVCLAAVGRLRALGAENAVIGSDVGSPGAAVYERIGFRTVTRHVPFGKKTTEPVV